MARRPKIAVNGCACAAVVALGLVGACRPTFEARASLMLDGATWQPRECHVQSRCTGIELVDDRQRRLELTIPPQTLFAWQQIGGAAQVRWLEAGRPPVGLGACGSLTLRGQGYHGAGKRAASGQALVDCRGPVAVRGDIDFVGCF
jgi:hypothetical protein